MGTFFQDLRFGFRQLRKSPAFTLSAILTLALGIGANATIFTWFSAVILNPVPGADSSHLVSVRWRTAEGSQRAVSWLDYLDFRRRSRTLESLAAVGLSPFSLGEGLQPERIWGVLASANYFDMLGVKAALGRTFVPEEDENPGGHPVVVLSHHLWQSKFGADPNIVGRGILLNKRKFTVVGVMPEPFIGSTLGLRFELWIPATMMEVMWANTNALGRRDFDWLQTQARVKPGVDSRQVEADLTSLSSEITREFSKTDRFNHAEVVPVWHDGGGETLGPVMILLMAVVGVVLLIACANVANLLLARATGRRREIAIRLALGVKRGRLVRQLLVENGMLALGGLAAALIALPVTMHSIMGFAPKSDLPIGLAVKTDASVIVFTVVVSLVATLLFGLMPALRASRPDVVAALKDESAGSTGSRRAWLRNSLVVAQVALSLVLLVCAGLLLKSLRRAVNAQPGFDPHNVLVAGVDLFPNGYDEVHARVAVRAMEEKIAALPGVTSVSNIQNLPLGLSGNRSSGFEAEGYTPLKNEEMVAMTNVTGPGYFHTVSTPLLAGREFTPADAAGTQKVVVVNQTLARHYFPAGDPVGRRVRIYEQWRVIAGVVADSKFLTLAEKPEPVIYLPIDQSSADSTTFVVRTTSDPARYARTVEDAIHSVDPLLPVYAVRPMETAISASYFGQSIGGSFLGFFGGVALVLAAIGLYGVLAYLVTQRSREVGIRMALGASRGDILNLILGKGMRLAGVGLAIGILIALTVTRLMRALLMDVSPTDVATIAGVCGLLIVIAMLASFIPAHRASRIDPILAIRHE
jgi:predicted permease